MNVKPKSDYQVRARDKATRNRILQATAPKQAKSAGKQIKKESAIVASWFSPQKYKGFKTKIK